MVDHNIEFRVYQVIDGEYPENINECSAYLITGSKSSAYENTLWIEQLRQYIVELNRYKIELVGICFGHQMIAHALGGRVEKSEKGWGVGNATCDVRLFKPWMCVAMGDAPEGGVPEQFSLLVTHQDQVICLPDGVECIAGNVFCEIASFQIEDHILGFQGRSEFSVDYLLYLLNKRRAVLILVKLNVARL